MLSASLVLVESHLGADAFGDLTKATLGKVGKVSGKVGKSVGKVGKGVGKVAKGVATGVGEVSANVAAGLSGLTGKEEYQFGDLSKAVINKLRRGAGRRGSARRGSV